MLGGTNDLSNLALLCHECHMKAHGQEAHANGGAG
jgi:hypothetical protein